MIPLTGASLTTFITGLNGGMAIDATLLDVLVSTAKTTLESERDWMVLRKTDTSKSATTAGLWTTAIDLSTITNFSHFYGDFPVRLFDGDNRIEHYRIVPWHERLNYKDIGNTACYDANTKNLYLNGNVAFNGTLYIDHVEITDEIDLTSASAIWTKFPARFVPVLGYYAVGIHKGAVDWDDIVKNMLGANQAAMVALKNAMEKWDDKLQHASIDAYDPTDKGFYPRDGAIDPR